MWVSEVIATLPKNALTLNYHLWKLHTFLSQLIPVLDMQGRQDEVMISLLREKHRGSKKHSDIFMSLPFLCVAQTVLDTEN